MTIQREIYRRVASEATYEYSCYDVAPLQPTITRIAGEIGTSCCIFQLTSLFEKCLLDALFLSTFTLHILFVSKNGF